LSLIQTYDSGSDLREFHEGFDHLDKAFNQAKENRRYKSMLAPVISQDQVYTTAEGDVMLTAKFRIHLENHQAGARHQNTKAAL